MKHQSTFIYLLQLLLYCLLSDIQTQSVNVKNVMVKVVKSNCTENERNTCRNKYLQICYNKKTCDGRMTLDCLYPPGFNTDDTLLTAEAGSTFNYTNIIEIAVIKQIIVGITKTTKTALNPLATSCEISRANTTNGIRVQTRSIDGRYQFELLIETICNISDCHGHKCEQCGFTTTLPTSKVITFDTSRTTSYTLTNLTTAYTTFRSTPTTILSDSTTTSLKTTKTSGDLPGSSSSITTTEEYSTISFNGNYTINYTSEFNNTGDSSKESQTTTVIVVSVVCCFVVIFVILIYIYWRKHNRNSRTTPDEKNRLVVNDGTEGEDKHINTDHSNDVNNKNKTNLHREDALNEENMVHVTTDNIDETVNSKGDENELISSKHNYSKDITSEGVSYEHEDNKTSNIVTETPEDTEQSNNGIETVSSVHADTDDLSTHQNKKKKKRKKKRSDAEEEKHSTSEDLPRRNFPVDENNVIANGKYNGYAPDDEHSDAALSNESEEQDNRKSDEIAMSSHVDKTNNDNQEIDSKSKSNRQNEDIKLSKAMEDGDFSTSNKSQNNRAMINSEDVSGNDVSSSDTVHHQAQSNGGFSHQEISRNDIENIAQAKVETLMHGKMSEMRKDITEHTNNSINQVKEEVSVLRQDITEQMRQQSNDFKEQIDKNTADLEKAEKKRQRKMKKLKDQIEECTERLKIFEARNDEYIQNKKLLEEKVEASGGKQDNARHEIIENKNEIQKLRDEMNRLSEILRQQISQQKRVISVPDTPLFTRTTHVRERSPHSNDLLRSRTASDDALYSRHSGSLATTDQYSELEKKRKKKKKKRTPSIHIPGDGTVHIQHEDNTIDIEQIGPMEVQQVNRGIRLTGGNVEIDIKSPRKKTIPPKPQKDQST